MTLSQNIGSLGTLFFCSACAAVLQLGPCQLLLWHIPHKGPSTEAELDCLLVRQSVCVQKVQCHWEELMQTQQLYVHMHKD